MRLSVSWSKASLLLLLAAAAATGFITVARSHHATGWDGYYYLVQVRSLHETGGMHSPEYSAVYLPLILLHGLTGNYTLAYRLTAVCIKVLFVFSVYILSLALTGKDDDSRVSPTAALTTAALSSFSPSLNYFFTQFPKNLLGFSFLFFFMAASIKAGQSPGKPFLKKWLFPLFLFLLTFFTHRYSAVLAVLFSVMFLASSLFRKNRGSVNPGRSLLFAAVVLMISAAVLAISETLPLAPSFRDIQRVTGDLSSVPILAPLEFFNTFGESLISPLWKAEILFASAVPLAVLLYCLSNGRKTCSTGGISLSLMALAGLFPFLSFSLEGLSYRLFFGTLLFYPPVLLPVINRAAACPMRGDDPPGSSFRAAIPLLPTLLLAAASFHTAFTYDPEIHDPPYSFYRDLSDEIVLKLSDRDTELIVAHKGLAEMLTFRHGVDALSWSPEARFHRERVWRVTAGVSGLDLRYYLGGGCTDSFYIPLSGDYGLLREDRWESFLDSISSDTCMMNMIDTWRNPMYVRPSYLTGSND